MTSDAPPPAPPIRFRIDEDREIKMFYGLQMDLQRMLPDPATAINLLINDPYTQDYVIRRLLTDKRSAVTDEKDLIPIEDVDLNQAQIVGLLDWVAQHTLDFFAKRSGAILLQAQSFQKALPSLSKLGFETSLSTTPSAGDSESMKTTTENSTGDSPTENSGSESS